MVHFPLQGNFVRGYADYAMDGNTLGLIQKCMHILLRVALFSSTSSTLSLEVCCK